jgi:hypothetical protein
MLKSAGKVILVLVASVSLSLAIGCGDDDGGGGGSDTDDDAATICDDHCDARETAAIERCEEVYIDCIEVDDGVGEECEVLALASCGLL